MMPPKPAYTSGIFQYFLLYTCPRPGNATASIVAFSGSGLKVLLFRDITEIVSCAKIMC